MVHARVVHRTPTLASHAGNWAELSQKTESLLVATHAETPMHTLPRCVKGFPLVVATICRYYTRTAFGFKCSQLMLHPKFENFILGFILLNTVQVTHLARLASPAAVGLPPRCCMSTPQLALEHHKMSDGLVDGLEWAGHVFNVVFDVECIVKITGMVAHRTLLQRPLGAAPSCLLDRSDPRGAVRLTAILRGCLGLHKLLVRPIQRPRLLHRRHLQPELPRRRAPRRLGRPAAAHLPALPCRQGRPDALQIQVDEAAAAGARTEHAAAQHIICDANVLILGPGGAAGPCLAHSALPPLRPLLRRRCSPRRR